MSPEVTGGLLGLLGGLLSGALAAYATVYVYRSQNAALENDEIRRRKVEIIFQLLGSRYVMIADYDASSAEVQVFNTAMALFSVYFTEPELKTAYDRFISSKTDDNLIDMLIAAARTADLELMHSNLKRVMVVKSRLFPLVVGAEYSGDATRK